ncbi:ArnT family glycosyltransferase [Paludisphaera mucosa]|uniref:Glycosyltransferase family 39 protein n=1 Tax=Paludisphaera mucosa TaxID=3030827 RepID=A0ABT6F6M7_9BACT|nr:glycosyltransferase family 39 protein [Paludisphaera mucosa]MDG3003064.1 glycosyltransferase family 39 protein [Paludisphaera mucosa]
MARKSRAPQRSEVVPPSDGREPPEASEHQTGPEGPPRDVRRFFWIGLAVVALLGQHLGLAERSLLTENPTVDEVVHMPAGLTYWDQHTFRLYHHNPPLVKMVAALPVWLAGPVLAPLYQRKSWSERDPSQANFAHDFAYVNADRYFELFDLARMVMPLFSIIGGLVVFAWSCRLYGAGGGLLSLALWVFCPNILAHGRLVTSDVGSTAFGAGATYLFWRYLRDPRWGRASLAGVALGLAQLTKFSMLLLYLVWPFLWLIRLVVAPAVETWSLRIGRGVVHGAWVVALSILTIDAGYMFEGVGRPLGSFEFASGSLTKPPPGGLRTAPPTRNQLYAWIWPFAQNRFRGTFLENLPAPLPEHYLLGFDEQKIEADGIPLRFIQAWNALNAGDRSGALALAGSSDRSVAGYSVYLNGVLRGSGWWYYYLAALAYKVPEGSCLLLLTSIALLFVARRSRESWVDEITLWTVPTAILLAMSVLTDINLGLRYILAVFPYLYIQAGKLVPFVESLAGRSRSFGRTGLIACVGLTALSSFAIHPDYLAYFNHVSGGPDRMPARLIDSNLDWGQDLVGLRRWCRENIPDEPIGLAYFGQINPGIFTLRGDGFDWFLPPIRPGHVDRMDPASPARLLGPARELKPGWFAVSASLVYGLGWRLYDPTPFLNEAWSPSWNAKDDPFGYFRLFEPVERIGHSILIYKLTAGDVARAAQLLKP